MLWRLLGREMMAGGVRSTASGGRWSSEHGGGVAPVGFGRGKRAGELREVEARLKEGSARADWVCSGGSAVGGELAGIRGEAAACSGFWGQGNGKRMRGSARRDFCSAHACERRERRPLQRARHRGSVVAEVRAALRSEGRVARPGKLQREEGRAVGSSGATSGSHEE